MNVTVTGATGVIGTAVVNCLLKAGHNVNAVGRQRADNVPREARFFLWNAVDGPPDPASIAGADAIVHLAGHPIAERWNRRTIALIRESRVEGTRNLVRAINAQKRRPEVLICASTVRIYGSRGDEILTEASSLGSDFLAMVASESERAAESADEMGVRVVRLRLGTVLGRDGIPAYLVPFQRVRPASSEGQWVSWIHIDDVASLVLFAIKNSALKGPVNACSPKPVTNAEFLRELDASTGGKAPISVPVSAIRWMFGDMASLVLDSQRAIPRNAEAAGFYFKYAGFSAAMKDLAIPSLGAD